MQCIITLCGLHSQLDLFIYLLAVLTILAILTDNANSTNTSSHKGSAAEAVALKSAAPGLPGYERAKPRTWIHARTRERASTGTALLADPPKVAREIALAYLKSNFCKCLTNFLPITIKKS